MSYKIENGSFIVGIGTLPVINEEFLIGTVMEEKSVSCIFCSNLAYGYDEQGKPWCYTPYRHPKDVFPIHKKIEIKQKSFIPQ